MSEEADAATPGVCVYQLSMDKNAIVTINENMSWADVVTRECGNATLTADETMKTLTFGPYCVRLDAGSIMRKLPVNETWAQMFAWDGSPVRRFHGPMVVFHSDVFETDWNAFKERVTAYFDAEVSNVALTKLEEMAIEDVSNDDEDKDQQ